MSAYDDDIESARGRLVSVGAILISQASKREDVVTQLVDKALVVAECANLPGDWPLRVWLFPNSFNLEA